MTAEQIREFIMFCALGSLLESEGIDAQAELTETEVGLIDAMANAEAARLTEEDAFNITVVTAKTLLRESIDRLLASETSDPEPDVGPVTS